MSDGSNPGAVVLLSGGLDSAVNMAVETQENKPSLALTVDYGQRGAGQEGRAAGRIASHFGVKHQVVSLPWLRRLNTSALGDNEKTLPQLSAADLDDAGPDSAAAKSAAAVWVPNRNGVLINVAAAFAETIGTRRIVVGFNIEEAATFPDNSLEFARAATAALHYSTSNQAQVITHTAEEDKTRIVARGLELAAPLEIVWSCYEDGIEHCGICESCMRVRRAFTAAAVPGDLWPAGLTPLE
jgi:7-cyano-7-deazaguanine synthase